MAEERWRKRLTPQQYRVLREKGTEMPFTGEYVDNHAVGSYKCAACGQELFRSSEKFDSGSGWPSFYDVVSAGNVELNEDDSLGMRRTEITCSKCGGHLGHLFPDGPAARGGQRYCVNSVALKFDPNSDKEL
jgi:peptide-methionine (R)-S-oxide reductase